MCLAAKFSLLKVVYDLKLQAMLVGHYNKRDFWLLSYHTSSVSSDVNSQALTRVNHVFILEE